jgi:hypothetical protein
MYSFVFPGKANCYKVFILMEGKNEKNIKKKKKYNVQKFEILLYTICVWKI